MDGLLDFIKTPAGQGLLAAAFGGFAGARRGTPFNNIGRAGLAGLAGYSEAQDREREQAQAVQMRELRNMQLEQARTQFADQKLERETAGKFFTPALPAVAGLDAALPPEFQTGAVPRPARPAAFDLEGFAQARMGQNPTAGIALMQALQKDSPFGKVDPKDYTPASVAAFARSRRYADLVPVRKMDVVNDQVVDLYGAQPGQTIDQIDPNKPFNRVGGQVVPNTPFQKFALSEGAAKSPKVQVDLRDPTAVARAGLDMQDRVRGAFKGDNVIANQFRAMQSAVQNPSAQGDTALLYSFFKVLDPESTVREGEIEMVKASRSIPDRLKGLAQKLSEGGTLLPEERADLLAQARRQVEGRLPRARADLQAYRENAQRLGLDPKLYAPDPYDGIDAPAKPRAAQAPALGAVQDGYRYMGGNPADPKSWRKL